MNEVQTGKTSLPSDETVSFIASATPLNEPNTVAIQRNTTLGSMQECFQTSTDTVQGTAQITLQDGSFLCLTQYTPLWSIFNLHPMDREKVIKQLEELSPVAPWMDSMHVELTALRTIEDVEKQGCSIRDGDQVACRYQAQDFQANKEEIIRMIKERCGPLCMQEPMSFDQRQIRKMSLPIRHLLEFYAFLTSGHFSASLHGRLFPIGPVISHHSFGENEEIGNTTLITGGTETWLTGRKQALEGYLGKPISGQLWRKITGQFSSEDLPRVLSLIEQRGILSASTALRLMSDGFTTLEEVEGLYQIREWFQLDAETTVALTALRRLSYQFDDLDVREPVEHAWANVWDAFKESGVEYFDTFVKFLVQNAQRRALHAFDLAVQDMTGSPL